MDKRGEGGVGARRIAKNTVSLYIRQILLLGVNLYAVRVLLGTLGAEDYGIYNVAAGTVAMFGFFSGAMATASQRYFAFELGRGDGEALQKTFSATLCIYLLLTVVIIFFAETAGLWFVHNKLEIPAGRLTAAKWIYQFALLSFVASAINIPYLAAIIAHEDMGIYAFMSMAEALLKLGTVFIVKYLPYDKLIVYGALLFFASVINTGLYRGYCKRRYAECVFKPVWDRGMFREICGFTGWSLFGSFTTVMRTQAITILVNQFFTPVVVAARSIAVQVSNALGTFYANFNTSLYAPIVKEYAGGRKGRMYSLVFGGCKITFFLMWIFALPLYLRMEYVLRLWLKDLPEYVAVFTRLTLIETLVTSISLPLMTAARATGKVKLYELALGSLQLIIFAGSFVWLEFFSGGPEAVFIVAIMLDTAMFFVRLAFVRRQTGLPLRDFLYRVILPVFAMVFCSALPALAADRFLKESFISLCIVCIVSAAASCACMWGFGISGEMKMQVITALRRKKDAP